jgi:serine/threonine-protein kinase RsbW
MERAIQSVQEFLAPLPEQVRLALGAAAREAVTNAGRHGNRGDPSKRIRIDARIGEDAAALSVEDEGPGFDHARLLQAGRERGAVTAARQRHREGRMGGLGIVMMLRCCDRVEYNDRGNRITLTKRLRPPP